MTDREKLARKWAEKKLEDEAKRPGLHLKEAVAAAEHILATTEPELPELNLWDGVEMYGREWVVWSVSETGSLGLLAADGGAYTHDFAENTTPNGKRYELREIVEPDHPEVLTTVEDYQNAPEGTTVAATGYGLWEKNRYAWSAGNRACDNGAMAKYECTVLRWGWGE